MKRIPTLILAFGMALSALNTPTNAQSPVSVPKLAVALATATPQNQAVVPVRYRFATGQQFSVYLTGYSFWDNTPPGSAAIAKPVIRQRAGGTGTHKDPITLAVGHSFATGRQVLDFPPGTRFYFPALRRYAIVEDVCGDGNSPQNGPCHTGHKGLPWIDIYVDGRKSGRGAANACMNRITGIHDVIVNPPANLPVQRGALTESGCST